MLIKRDVLKQNSSPNSEWMPRASQVHQSRAISNAARRKQSKDVTWAMTSSAVIPRQTPPSCKTTGVDSSGTQTNPLFAQRGYVDVYLFQEDTDRMVTSWTSQDNGQNRLSFEPTDSWWANRQAADNIQPNQNISWPFYFVVLPAGDPLTGTTSRLATFTALQTTLPYTIAVARASSSSAAAAASASAASASAQSASARSSTITGILTGSAAAAASSSAIQSSLSAALESSLRASGLSGTETLQGTPQHLAQRFCHHSYRHSAGQRWSSGR